MIENDVQYKLTKKCLKEFEESLLLIDTSINQLLVKIQQDSIKSQIDEFLNDIAEYESTLRLKEKVKEILISCSKDNYECIVDLEGFRKVKAKIIGVKFDNIHWKPVHVEFLEELNRTDDELEYNNGCWCGDDCQGHSIKVTSRYFNDYVNLEQIEIKK